MATTQRFIYTYIVVDKEGLCSANFAPEQHNAQLQLLVTLCGHQHFCTLKIPVIAYWSFYYALYCSVYDFMIMLTSLQMNFLLRPCGYLLQGFVLLRTESQGEKSKSSLDASEQ